MTASSDRPTRRRPPRRSRASTTCDLQDDPGDLDLWTGPRRRGRRPGPRADGRAAAGSPSRWRRTGHDVTAVDLDPAMLARARAGARRRPARTRRPPRARPRRRRRLELGRSGPAARARFRLAFIALNSILLLPSRAAQRRRLASARRAPRAGRPRRGRHLAARRPRPGPLRRPSPPRVPPARPGDRALGDEDGGRPARRGDADRRPHDDLRGGRPGRARRPLGPPRRRAPGRPPTSSARWPRRPALRSSWSPAATTSSRSGPMTIGRS